MLLLFLCIYLPVYLKGVDTVVVLIASVAVDDDVDDGDDDDDYCPRT